MRLDPGISLILPLTLLWAAACSRPAGPLRAGGRGGGTPPPAASPAGLASAAAGDGAVWLAIVRPDPGFEVALFQAGQPTNVYAGAPARTGIQGDRVEVAGLANGIEQFFGLAIRAASQDPWSPAGSVVRARPNPPIYVDAAASGPVADGRTPETAFRDLPTAFAQAAAVGQANLWLRDGQYPVTSQSTPIGSAVAGGFGTSFLASDREPDAGRTVLLGSAGHTVLHVAGGGALPLVLDGLVVDGSAGATLGLEVDRTPLELRSVRVERMTGRGIRVAGDPLALLPILLVHSSVTRNGLDGLVGNGAFALHASACQFDLNGQEGIDLNDLFAPPMAQGSLHLEACQFFGNGMEGLDVDLVATMVLGDPVGGWDLQIVGCRFDENQSDGMLIDHDHELNPEFHAALVVRDCVARGNAGSGFRLDLDSTGDVLMHRCLAAANVQDGFLVGSESNPGVVALSASAAVGNGGYGIRATFGNKVVSASHCLLAGNFTGGMLSDHVESAASSCATYLQPVPWTGTRVLASVEVTTAQAQPFRLAPLAFDRILSLTGTTVFLEGRTVAADALVELFDDGIARVPTSVQGSTLVFASVPDRFFLPGLLAEFAPGTGVVEDWRPSSGSPLLGAGLTPPGGAPVDCGPFGNPAGGAPGVMEVPVRPVFRLLATTPAPSAGIAAQEPCTLLFSAPLDPTSLTSATVRVVTRSSAVLTAPVSVQESRLVLHPPATGWGIEPFVIELHRGIQSAALVPLTAPLVLPFTPR